MSGVQRIPGDDVAAQLAPFVQLRVGARHRGSDGGAFCIQHRDVNGTEARAFAGGFLYSTGANEVAGRFTAGHFDLPMRRCTITLDGEAVVCDGELVVEAPPPMS